MTGPADVTKPEVAWGAVVTVAPQEGGTPGWAELVGLQRRDGP